MGPAQVVFWPLVVLVLTLGRATDAAGQASEAPAAASRSDVDAILASAWQGAGLEPSPGASDEEFVRRVYLDLLGRIPTVEEVLGFLASDDQDRREKLVERLLDDPDYANHMGTVWANLLVGRRPQDRDVDRDALTTWLRKQFAANTPWNQVVSDLVTATGNNRENGAVNFTLAHAGDGAVNLTSYTMRLFLGQQIQCTQCHDHPSNDWKQADFWGINAFFKGVRSRQIDRVDASGAEVYDSTELYDEPTEAYATFETRSSLIGIAFPTYLDGRKISQGTDVNRRGELAAFLLESDNLQLAQAFVNRLWGHFMGVGIVQPVDDFGDHNTPSLPELLDGLARDFQASGYDVKRMVRVITSSRAYQLTSRRTAGNRDDHELFTHMQLKPMTPEQLFDSLLVATAAHKAGGDKAMDQRRDAWLRQFIFTFANDEAEEGSLFQGTIPQALMMMNGDLIQRATGSERGSMLDRLKTEAIRKGRGRPQTPMIQLMYLATLSRQPTAAELTRATRYLSSGPDTEAILEDLFWSLLNSNEFILNH